MFRRLASVLFKEEEIVIEEEISDHVGEVEIPELKPILPKEKKIVEKPKIVTEHVDITETVIREKPITDMTPDEVANTASELNRKSRMITADDDLAKRKMERAKAARTSELEVKKFEYQRKDIISPMYGGPSQPSEPLDIPKKKYPSKHVPVAEVISPMYGKVQEESKAETRKIDESLMDLRVDDIISNEGKGETVQVSLYDYLEGIDEHEE
ncbi:hypothetical protein [Erysipelothrix piscisicarius]|uniref:Uncharacterized protein n=1 Tax=Erysipelothrix piscisicarius TaxID=2485784 RepID=A0A3S8RNI1_9FIRM|nr:hypothetical protein [Erysipelothrix piscisicarius]AZK44508.1 hypothetical protein EEI45_07015 [Erysipelothrix piscisicarius]